VSEELVEALGVLPRVETRQIFKPLLELDDPVFDAPEDDNRGLPLFLGHSGDELQGVVIGGSFSNR
jgi:hypothetical protein